nr:hypothetical protein [uncultured Sphingobium sp.]
MSTIEFHGWGARFRDVETADRLVFDLEPDQGFQFKEVASAAFYLQDVVGQMGSSPFRWSREARASMLSRR